MNYSIKKGYILMLITVVIWGMDNVLIKSLLNDNIPTFLIIYLRFIFATLVSAVILKIKKENYDKDLINFKYKKLIIIMSMLLSLYYILQINGLNMTKAVISEFVGTTMSTIFTIIILALFIKNERKQIVNIFTIISLFLAFLGTFMITLCDISFGLDFGVILILIADIFWGLYMVTYLKIDKNFSALRVNKDIGIIAIIIYTIILLCTKEINLLFNLGFINILKIAFISVVIDVGTITTYYVAIRIISGVKCSILSLAAPIITFILSYFYLGERIVFIQLIGCIMLFTSSLILAIKDLIENKKSLEDFKNG